MDRPRLDVRVVLGIVAAAGGVVAVGALFVGAGGGAGDAAAERPGADGTPERDRGAETPAARRPAARGGRGSASAPGPDATSGPAAPAGAAGAAGTAGASDPEPPTGASRAASGAPSGAAVGFGALLDDPEIEANVLFAPFDLAQETCRTRGVARTEETAAYYTHLRSIGAPLEPTGRAEEARVTGALAGVAVDACTFLGVPQLPYEPWWERVPG